MTADKVQTSITLDEELLEWVDSVAEGADMSRSAVINFILRIVRDNKQLLSAIIETHIDKEKARLKRFGRLMGL